MSYKVLKLVEYMQKKEKLYLRIGTRERTLDISFEKSQLPHLLGLHYMYPSQQRKSGIELFQEVLQSKLSDEMILQTVKEEQGSGSIYTNIHNRIASLSQFLEQLEEGVLVDKTSLTTKIKSQYLAVKEMNGKYGQLGILYTGNVGYLADYHFDQRVFLHTFSCY